MGRKTSNVKYDTVKIPTGLTKKIDDMLKKDNSYTSRTDVIKSAVRQLYDDWMDRNDKKNL